MTKKISENGYTLLEVIAALAIGSVLAGAIYAAYAINQKSDRKNRELISIQQNTRAAIMIMGKDISHAGYNFNPETVTYGADKPYGFCDTSDNDILSISMLDPLEPDSEKIIGVTYKLEYNATDKKNELIKTEFVDCSSVSDGCPSGCTENPGMAIAENIDKISFVYLIEDGDQQVKVKKPTSSQLPDIKAVEITLLTRADRQDKKTTTQTYVVPQPSNDSEWKFTDNYNRKLVTQTIACRNLN